MQDLLSKIHREIRSYLINRERELRAKLRGGIKVEESWNGYNIIIEGNIVQAQHDSSTHRWTFYLEEDWDGRSEMREILTISEKYTGELRLDEKALNQNLPRRKTIFVCSMNDLFAESVPDEYIHRILDKTRERLWSSTFLFQTKNPKRMIDFIGEFPDGSIFATTIESNRNLVRTKAPPPEQRMKDFLEFKEAMMEENLSHLYEVTIEPVLKFDLFILTAWLESIKPDVVNIGADSKKHNLPEPNEGDVVELVRRLEHSGIDVHLKKNLKRIAPSLFGEGVMPKWP